jgi:hypothetical protein
MKTLHHLRFAGIAACALLAWVAVFAGAAAAQQLPVVDAVIGNNFGRLPIAGTAALRFQGPFKPDEELAWPEKRKWS